MNGPSDKKEMAIDDEYIAKPPYPGPEDKLLSDIELSKDKIMTVLDRLFDEFRQKGKSK